MHKILQNVNTSRFIGLFGAAIFDIYVRSFVPQTIYTNILSILLTLMLLGGILYIFYYDYNVKDMLKHYVYIVLIISFIGALLYTFNESFVRQISINKDLFLLINSLFASFNISKFFKDPSRFNYLTFIVGIPLIYIYSIPGMLISLLLSYIEQHLF